jgi:hypothetical protein
VFSRLFVSTRVIALLIFPGICAFAQTGERLGFDEISQVIQTFEQLPPEDQRLWLDRKWTQVSDARWLPVLQKLAARELILRQGSRPDLDPGVAVTEIALKRWYELDPQTGREAILREIASPLPRFGEDALGMLPDRTLQVEQHIIAKHFALLSAPAPIVPSGANRYTYLHRFDTMAAHQIYEANLASLLFRYADGDVLPEVLPIFQNRLAEGNCNAQFNEIAFLLKVNADAADLVMREVLSNRPTGHAGCVLEFYSKIGALVRSPILERFAIESLNDDDLFAAADALRYLRRYGSAKAEKPIFERLTSWNAKWRGRVSELIPANEPATFDDQLEFNPNQAERSFGMELARALVRGHEWHADEVGIRQIFSLALDPTASADTLAAIKELGKAQARVH